MPEGIKETIIHYTIIALKSSEVEEVVNILRGQNYLELADWLKNNNEYMYGNFYRNWKPLKDETLDDLLEMEEKEEENVVYLLYDLIMEEDIDYKAKFEGFRKAKINVAFIDPFTVFLEKYKKLISKIDANVTDGEKCLCCIIMPVIEFKELEDCCFKEWNSVISCYKQGASHRIAYKKNDIFNFKNNLKQIPLAEVMLSDNAKMFKKGKIPKLT